MFKIVNYIMPIRLLLRLQLFIALLLLIICLFMTNSCNSVLSATIGSLLVFSLTYLTYFLTLHNSLVVLPNIAIKNHKKTMIYKFFINIIFFLLIYILYKNCNYLWLFIGYISTQLSFWFVLILK
jgi:hypothetical protein